MAYKTYNVYSIVGKFDSCTIKKINKEPIMAADNEMAVRHESCWFDGGTLFIALCLEDGNIQVFEKIHTKLCNRIEPRDIKEIKQLLFMIG